MSISRVIVSTSVLAVVAGILFFCWYNHWLTVTLRVPTFGAVSALASPAATKPVSFFYWHERELKHEKRELFCSSDLAQFCTLLILNWLNLLDEEGVILKPVLVQAVSISPSNNELFISFDHSPYNSESSVYDRWMLTEALLKTLREARLPIQHVRFLVHHAPLVDPYLDFSRSWPVAGFLDSPFDCAPYVPPPTFTIMLDPSGDAAVTGRVIQDGFERGLTLQCAESLKEALESRSKRIRVIISRLAGQALEPFERISFANRLGVDLYLSIHFYQEDASELALSLYYCSYSPVSDAWSKPEPGLVWVPYNEAYRPAFKVSQALACALTKALQSQSTPFVVRPAYGLPAKPLMGVAAPAVLVEYGLKTSDDWKPLVPLLAQALVSVAQA